jgi:D-beta-D-heptose 7-phosphate kinase/D-beta-D-heptose 1-phosphate adenosyltransferase
MKIVVCSGGFDPLHSGHITYFRAAQALGDKLIVGINSDEWLQRKKGKPFMSWYERSLIVGSIRFVDFTMSFDDDDDSAIALLERVKVFWPNEEIIFANGGDRNSSNNRESGVLGVEFVYGVGGSNKMNSSSEILKNWQEKNPHLGV